MKRHILHINIVSFYVAVAQALEPKLRSYPVAVATSGVARRVLLDVSSVARTAHLYKGMTVERAKRLCPDLVVLYPSPHTYRRASNAVLSEASKLSPCVESAGPGHIFVDLSGTSRLLGRCIDVADRFRKTIQNKFGLGNAAGLGGNKLVSKIATRVVCTQTLCTVMQGCEETFMAPIPIQLLPGIDSKVISQMKQFNFRIIKDICKMSEKQLLSALGPVASDIYRMSRGIDYAAVREIQTSAPVIEKHIVLVEQTNDDAVILKQLFDHVVLAGVELRSRGLAARKLKLTLTYYDGIQTSRCCTLLTPLCGDLSLFEKFNTLYHAAYTRRIRISTLDLVLQELTYPYGQLNLFLDTEKEHKLMNALDIIRKKFGPKGIAFFGIPGFHRLLPYKDIHQSSTRSP